MPERQYEGLINDLGDCEDQWMANTKESTCVRNKINNLFMNSIS